MYYLAFCLTTYSFIRAGIRCKIFRAAFVHNYIVMTLGGVFYYICIFYHASAIDLNMCVTGEAST